MNKKLLLFLILVIGLLSGLYFFSKNPSPSFGFNSYCAFCDSSVIERQKFYEDELVVALYIHKPIFPGHCLIIPKRHIERFEMLTDVEIAKMGKAIKKVNQAVKKVYGTSSYLLYQKNGREVGQSVPHVHFHYLPRKTGDDSTLKFIIRMYIANAKQPISSEDMQEAIEKLREAIE